jgi:predicted membrane channel-forming protein YqfA (hemolysin III family)
LILVVVELMMDRRIESGRRTCVDDEKVEAEECARCFNAINIIISVYALASVAGIVLYVAATFEPHAVTTYNMFFGLQNTLFMFIRGAAGASMGLFVGTVMTRNTREFSCFVFVILADTIVCGMALGIFVFPLIATIFIGCIIYEIVVFTCCTWK